jgi:hypothetical protein
MTKQQTLELLDKQMPSFYSLEQVKKIVSDISDGPTLVDDGKFDELVDSITNDITRMGVHIADSFEYELDCDCISVSDISLDTDAIRDTVMEAIQDWQKS